LVQKDRSKLHPGITTLHACRLLYIVRQRILQLQTVDKHHLRAYIEWISTMKTTSVFHMIYRPTVDTRRKVNFYRPL